MQSWSWTSWLAAAIASAALCISPAGARPPASHAPAHIEAAREFASVLFVDSHFVAAIAEQEVRQDLPRLRRRWPADDRITTAHRAALNTFIETIPGVAREEIERLLPEFIEDAAPIIADVFTHQELALMIPAYREEKTRQMIAMVVAAGGGPYDAETDHRMAEFDATPAGAIFAPRSATLMRLLRGRLTELGERYLAAISRRIEEGACEALGDECPAALRLRLGPP